MFQSIPPNLSLSRSPYDRTRDLGFTGTQQDTTGPNSWDGGTTGRFVGERRGYG